MWVLVLTEGLLMGLLHQYQYCNLGKIREGYEINLF